MIADIAKRFWLLTSACLLFSFKALLAQSGSTDTLLINREKAKWEALRTANFGAHPEWFAASFVSIGYLPDGSVYRTGTGKPQTPAAIHTEVKFPPAIFEVSNFNVLTPSPAVKIITYQADGPLNLYVTTVWSRKDGEWKSIFYQATKYR